MNSEPTIRLPETWDLLIVVKAGSLIPASRRIEEEGWISSDWVDSENNRRANYYGLTKDRVMQRGVKTKRWAELAGPSI